MHHARLGPLEEWLEAKSGPGVIDRIAERAVLRTRFVKGDRERLLTTAFTIRVVVLMTLCPDGGIGDAAIAAGRGPGAGAVVEAVGAAGAGARGLADALGPEPLEDLQDVVLRAADRSTRTGTGGRHHREGRPRRPGRPTGR